MKTRRYPTSLREPLRRELTTLDPLLSVRRVRTLEQHRLASVGAPRFNTLLVSTFVAIAGLLALSGIYSVTCYAVSRARARSACA